MRPCSNSRDAGARWLPSCCAPANTNSLRGGAGYERALQSPCSAAARVCIARAGTCRDWSCRWRKLPSLGKEACSHAWSCNQRQPTSRRSRVSPARRGAARTPHSRPPPRQGWQGATHYNEIRRGPAEGHAEHLPRGGDQECLAVIGDLRVGAAIKPRHRELVGALPHGCPARAKPTPLG